MGQPTTVGPGWAVLLLAAYPLVLIVAGRRRVLASVLFLYAVAVTAITVFPVVPRPGRLDGEPWWAVLQLVPFQVEFLSFVLNVVMFVPFGVLLPLIWARRATLRRLAVAALCASATIETVQLALCLAVRRPVAHRPGPSHPGDAGPRPDPAG